MTSVHPESVEGVRRWFILIIIHVEKTIMSSSRMRGSMGSENRLYRWIPAFAGMTNLLNVPNDNEYLSLLELH